MIKQKKILFVCGGTGGHVYPAIAVANELRSRSNNYDIVFVGNKDGFEIEAIKKENFEIKTIKIKGFARREVLKNLVLPYIVPVAILQSLVIILKEKPKFIFATGGYACLPILFAARILRKKIYLQEQNSYPGITIRLFASYAKNVFLGFENASKYLGNKTNTMVTGNPARKKTGVIKVNIREKYDAKDSKILFIFGGSQGSVPINNIVVNLIDSISKLNNIMILWQTGARDYTRISDITKEYNNIHIMPFVDNIYDFYEVSNLALCRAGAMTVVEIAKFSLPAILIPLPESAENHQLENAHVVENNNSGICLEQKDAKEKLVSLLSTLLGENSNLKIMQNCARNLYIENSTLNIATELEKELN